jgi:hypothetical protein
MAADAEGGHGEGHVHGLFGGFGPGHERRAGEDLSRVQLEDGAVDSGGHPEIVGIDDKTRHGDSLSIPQEKRFAMWRMGCLRSYSGVIRVAGMMGAGPVSGSHPKWAASSVG